MGCQAGLEHGEATSACADSLDTWREQPALSPKEHQGFLPACKKLSSCPLVTPCHTFPIHIVARSNPVPDTKGSLVLL